MTLDLTPPATWTVGQYVAVPVTISGPSPVHAVMLDLIGDGQPAWYFTQADARATTPFLLGPMKKKGRFELTAHAVDEMGCEISNGVRVWVTIQQ